METKIHLASFMHEGEFYKGLKPEQATMLSAGLDVRTPYAFKLEPGEQHLVNLGLIIRAPRNYCIQVLPRSGLACKHGIQIPNAPGLIDRDYCGPEDLIKVMLRNTGEEAFQFNVGDRVAQLLFTPYVTPYFFEEESATFSSGFSRGGFGSTGKD